MPDDYSRSNTIIEERRLSIGSLSLRKTGILLE